MAIFAATELGRFADGVLSTRGHGIAVKESFSKAGQDTAAGQPPNTPENNMAPVRTAPSHTDFKK